MKRFLICLLAGFAVFCLSCKSTASSGGDSNGSNGVVISGEVTQEKVNDALGQIYDNYRASLDLTNAQTYTVVYGDTLSAITRRFYGSLTNVGESGPSNGFYFPVIMAASGHTIVDPDFIQPGMHLTIPDLRRNLDSSESRKAIKECLNDVSYVYNRKGVKETEEGLKRLANSL